MSDVWGIAGFAVSLASAALAGVALFRGRHRVAVSLSPVSWTAGVGSVPIARVAVTSIGRAMSIEKIHLEWISPGKIPWGFQVGNVQRPQLPVELAALRQPFEEWMPTFHQIQGGYPMGNGESKPFFFQLTPPEDWIAQHEPPLFTLVAKVEMAHRKKAYQSNEATFLALDRRSASRRFTN